MINQLKLQEQINSAIMRREVDPRELPERVAFHGYPRKNLQGS